MAGQWKNPTSSQFSSPEVQSVPPRRHGVLLAETNQESFGGETWYVCGASPRLSGRNKERTRWLTSTRELSMVRPGKATGKVLSWTITAGDNEGGTGRTSDHAKSRWDTLDVPSSSWAIGGQWISGCTHGRTWRSAMDSGTGSTTCQPSSKETCYETSGRPTGGNWRATVCIAPTGPKQKCWWCTSRGSLVGTLGWRCLWPGRRPSILGWRSKHGRDRNPSSRKQTRCTIYESMLQDLGGYFVNTMRRQAVEVSEKRLTPAEREQFREAKMSEVKNFLAAEAFQALPKHLQPDKSQAIGMRWVLTWKTRDDGSQKAKARAVLKGFQDPEYEYRSTTTPVMTRQTRQLQFQVSAHRRWRVRKGDVTGAFLQGRPYPGILYCLPCSEILTAMGLSEGDIVRVRRGCYGLVDAPLEWYRTVSEFFATLGLLKSWSDPCCWLWKPKGVLSGMISGHVDDFLFSGPTDDPQWKAIEEAIQQQFKWSDWEEGTFTQCGVQVTAQKNGSFTLSQPGYADKINEVSLNAVRRKEPHLPTTDKEKSQMRATLGGLSWHAQQVAPHFSAEVSLLLSEVSTSTVSTITKVNQLLWKARARKDHHMIIHAHNPNDELVLYAWVDAAGQNRSKGGSTQGIFIGMAPKGLLEGNIECVTPIAWHSNKIERTVRSPGAAEAAATVNGEDLLFHARYQYGEMVETETDVFDVDKTANQVTGVLISDSRNVYDKLQTEELSVKGAERRTDIEMLCLKSAQRNNGVLLRWVHSEAQLGNSLTKENTKELELYYKMGYKWRIVCDDDMRSARKRRVDGLTALQQGTQQKQQEHTPKENGHPEETVHQNWDNSHKRCGGMQVKHLAWRSRMTRALQP